jgi:hypothetical protein
MGKKAVGRILEDSSGCIDKRRCLFLPEVRPLWNQELLSKIGQEWRLKDPSLRFYGLDSWRTSVVTGGEEILSEVGISSSISILK